MALCLYLLYDIKPHTDADDRRVWLCVSSSTLLCNVYMFYIFIVSNYRGTLDGSAEVPKKLSGLYVCCHDKYSLLNGLFRGIRNAIQDR